MQLTDRRTEERITRVIESIQQNIGESITIDDMARIAMFSKFHFSRVFQRATGISPGRFLSAVRLQEAKRLLLTTSLSVTDIGQQVGYTSGGTFSTRFKKCVGLSPSDYRRLGGTAPHIADAPPRPRHRASMHGQVRVSGEITGELGTVFVGLFPEPIPQGAPVRCTVLSRPGPYRLDNVPLGQWYLLAQSVRPGREECVDERPAVAVHGPVAIDAVQGSRAMDVRLRPMQILDPPVLMALSDARRSALRRAS
ncbi:helix-turn-helix domain-containing protein [Actinomadura fibrosa]|uniref:Helix-turn-helix domain-containing protein n=1 Tax=Actinomadura fibrosa TaxID=111802 RepID=A0ABW2Y0V8_9ACTN|nr:AraC family transcriptional regulator [Actinomadura fibrosa]